MTLAQKKLLLHIPGAPTRPLAVALFLAMAICAANTPTPHYAAPAPLAHAGDSPGLPPLQLLGVSLRQSGVEITDDTPELDSSAPLTITACWMPSIRMEASVPIEVTLWDHLNLISQTLSFRAGPDSESAPWEVGSVYTQEYEIPLTPIAIQFSGKTYLLIAPRQPPNASDPSPPFQLLRTMLRPAVMDRPLPEDAVEAAFPHATTVLAKQVRMGLGSDVTFQTPDWPENVRRIGVISSMSYRSVPQGEPVCRLVVNEGLPDEQTVHIISGTMTARCDYDLFQRNQLNHDRAAIFTSRDSAQLDKEGRPTLLHTYYGVIDLREPVPTITSLRFLCETETILDIHGAVPLVE